MLLFCALLVAGAVMGCGHPLEKLQANIERDDQGEIVSVHLNDMQITNTDLVHLEGLAKLQELYLYGTRITDAGLERLKGLTEMQVLSLDNTQITAAGLVHIKGMTNLRTLYLSDTQITNAGLDHLKGRPSCGHSTSSAARSPTPA